MSSSQDVIAKIKSFPYPPTGECPKIIKQFIDGIMDPIPVPDLDWFKNKDQTCLDIAAGMFYNWGCIEDYTGPDEEFDVWFEDTCVKGNFNKMGKEFAKDFDYSGVIVPDLPNEYWQAKHVVSTANRDWVKCLNCIDLNPVKNCALALHLYNNLGDNGKYNKDPNIPVDMAKMIMYHLPKCVYTHSTLIWPNMVEKGYTQSFGPGWSMNYLTDMCTNEVARLYKDNIPIFKTIFYEGEQLYGEKWANIVRKGFCRGTAVTNKFDL